MADPMASTQRPAMAGTFGGSIAGLAGMGATAAGGLQPRSMMDMHTEVAVGERRLGFACRSGREMIQIQVGRAGCGMGHEFLRDLVEEHQIEYNGDEMRGTFFGNDLCLEQHLDVFFNEGAPHLASGQCRWVPRCILVDLNMQDLAQITSGPLGHLYKPENLVGTDEGSGNCYATARNQTSEVVMLNVEDIVRHEAEKANCLQGVQFTHSIIGGTGSGVTSLLIDRLKEYLESKTSGVMLQAFTLFPSPEFCDVVVEPYNAVLGMEDLIEHCHQVFVYDNNALSNVCRKSLGSAVPKRQEMNNVVALCMSGITSGMRFKGPLNADIWKMNQNLVPWPRHHFLCSSFAPLNSEESGLYRKKSVLDLAQQMLLKDNYTCNCDPMAKTEPKARVLASWASWRGEFKTEEVDRILYDMSRPGSRFDELYPDWIPNPIASNVCSQGHCNAKDSVVYVTNNTRVTDVFGHTLNCFNKLWSQKSFVHNYVRDGVEEKDMMSAYRALQDLKASYESYATKPDKIYVVKKPDLSDAIDEKRLTADEIDVARLVLKYSEMLHKAEKPAEKKK